MSVHCMADGACMSCILLEAKSKAMASREARRLLALMLTMI